MSDDFKERLRNTDHNWHEAACAEAEHRIEAQAAEIERLQATVGDRMEFYLDRIEAQAAEIERLREALRDAAEVIEICNTVFLHKLGTTNKWRNAVLAKARAALAGKAEQ